MRKAFQAPPTAPKQNTRAYAIDYTESVTKGHALGLQAKAKAKAED